MEAEEREVVMSMWASVEGWREPVCSESVSRVDCAMNSDARGTSASVALRDCMDDDEKRPRVDGSPCKVVISSGSNVEICGVMFVWLLMVGEDPRRAC